MSQLQRDKIKKTTERYNCDPISELLKINDVPPLIVAKTKNNKNNQTVVKAPLFEYFQVNDWNKLRLGQVRFP